MAFSKGCEGPPGPTELLRADEEALVSGAYRRRERGRSGRAGHDKDGLGVERRARALTRQLADGDGGASDIQDPGAHLDRLRVMHLVSVFDAERRDDRAQVPPQFRQMRRAVEGHARFLEDDRGGGVVDVTL